MSSITLCLFSVALCNVGNLDQHLFSQQAAAPQQQYGQQQQQGLFGQATNLFNGFVNQGLGGYNFNNPQQQTRPQSPCMKKFRYVTDGRQWKGVIKIANIDLSNDLVIEADFALPQV